jgi:NAD(P)H-flavin reductase
VFNSETYLPRACVIKDVVWETSDTRTLTLAFQDGRGDAEHAFLPGQFVQLGRLGVGEVPVSISSSPTDTGRMEICMRTVGKVTEALGKRGQGDELGIRGPFGTHFPVDEFKEHDLLFVAGGLGLAPLRSVIRYVLARRPEYGKVTILYGARTPNDLLFRRELAAWADAPDTEVLQTVDVEHPEWDGRVGVVTALLDAVAERVPRSTALVCGPPVMMRYASSELLKRNARPERIYLTLERYMKCGVGTCGHCYVGGKYVCQDGPVFRYPDLDELRVYEAGVLQA